MIYIIHKMLVSLKNYLNFLSEDNIFKCFLKEYNNLKKKTKKQQHIMMEDLSLKKEIKDIRTLFRLEKETKAIKDTIIRDIKNLFEQGEENYYKPVTVSNFWSNN